MPEYTVKQGDCISSISIRYGLSPDKIWDHPKNSELKEIRKDPNVLYPGDIVFVPDKEEKKESCATEQRHRFRKKGLTTRLKLCILDEEKKPMSEAQYFLDVGGKIIEGKLDSDGKLNIPIPSDASIATLKVGEFPDSMTYEIKLGHVDPLDTISGIQSRLNNLGFNCGPSDGIMKDHTIKAIWAFQKQYDLTVDGKIGPETRKKIKDVFGR